MIDGLSDKQSDFNGRSILAAQLGRAEDIVSDHVSDKAWRGAWKSLQASKWPEVKCPTGKLAWDAFKISASGKRWENLGSLSFHMVPYLTEHKGAEGLEKFYVGHVWSAISRNLYSLFRNSSKAQTWWAFMGGDTAPDNKMLGSETRHYDDFTFCMGYLVDLIIDSLLDDRVEPNDQEFKSDFVDLFHYTGWVRFFQHICFVSEPYQTIKFDETGRLHCETGPAIRYPDGFAVYAWHGTLYPSHWAIKRPSAKEAFAWENIEQRRVACEMVGWDKIIEEVGAITIDKDKDPEIGELLSVEIPRVGIELFLRVTCGTGRDFVMPVPPEMQTARQANAWTWGLGPDEYKPEVRT
ncbi:hypothetical protein N9M10_02740 [Hellea sp.]|nr:hypothetical protein [Hellea sp.]